MYVIAIVTCNYVFVYSRAEQGRVEQSQGGGGLSGQHPIYHTITYILIRI